VNRLRRTSGRPKYPFVKHECEHQLEMVRPSSIAPEEVSPVPEGYALRQLRGDDEGQYEDLFHLAFEDEGRFPEIRDRALDGGFFVVEHLAVGQLVSSCVALRGSSSPRHPEAGQLGWLVCDLSHTRKSLGTIVSASATNRLAAEGYPQPFLGTEDFRIAAISIYLNLGWRPYIYSGDMESRWRSIFVRLSREFEAAPGIQE
jgi:mycothiol synthase